MNFTRLLTASALAQPSSPSVCLDDRRVDYLALSMTAQRIATILAERHGIGRGDRVTVMLPDVPEFAFVYFGVLWGGGVAAVLDPTLDTDGIAAAVRDSGARLMIAWHAGAEEVEAACAAAEIDVDWLFVEPGEFSRLLAGVSPRLRLHDPVPTELAVVHFPAAAPSITLSHGELILGARSLAQAASLTSADVVLNAAQPGPDSCEVLGAAVSVGASLILTGETNHGQEAGGRRPSPAATVAIGSAGAIDSLLGCPNGGTLDRAPGRSALRVCVQSDPREVEEMVSPTQTAAS